MSFFLEQPPGISQHLEEYCEVGPVSANLKGAVIGCVPSANSITTFHRPKSMKGNQSMLRIAIAATLAVIAGSVHAGETPSADGAKVFFMNINDGDVLSSPVSLKFGITGMSIEPAGTEKPMTGHHHLIIDDVIKPEALAQPIHSDERHIHFGKAQVETSVVLPSGEHTLQLVLGDWTHVPHNPPVVSERIKITVK